MTINQNGENKTIKTIEGEEFSSKPSAEINAKNASADLLKNLDLITEVFESIEKETAEIADMIFEYLVGIDDENIKNGTIPPHNDKKINGYVNILNRLFLLSRKDGSFRVINRKTVEGLDKKTFTISMCHDGGVSLDILCDVVNVENQARIPTKSPVRVTVTKLVNNEVEQLR